MQANCREQFASCLHALLAFLSFKGPAMCRQACCASWPLHNSLSPATHMESPVRSIRDDKAPSQLRSVRVPNPSIYVWSPVYPNHSQVHCGVQGVVLGEISHQSDELLQVKRVAGFALVGVALSTGQRKNGTGQALQTRCPLTFAIVADYQKCSVFCLHAAKATLSISAISKHVIN